MPLSEELHSEQQDSDITGGVVRTCRTMARQIGWKPERLRNSIFGHFLAPNIPIEVPPIAFRYPTDAT